MNHGTEYLERWRASARHLSSTRIRHLIDLGGSRQKALSQRLGALRLDLTRHRIDEIALAVGIEWAQAVDWAGQVRAMFSGAAVNASEQRPVLHAALRSPESPAAPLAGPMASAATRAAVAESAEARTRMAELLAAQPDITDLVHVGIGGSDLGPRLVCEALGRGAEGRRVHFVANVDGEAVARVLATVDPRRTLVALVSKSFTTQETLLNGRVLIDWLAACHGRETALARHVVAVSSRPPAAAALGIPAGRVLPMGEWVGGRYSLWSTVGLPIAFLHGMPAFERLLAGAHLVDQHYAGAPPGHNLPLLFALVGLWERLVKGRPSRTVVPYDERLRLLPSFLQQLEMESNGKRVDRDGAPLATAAAAAVFGEVGTNAQHAYFQALHQGTDVIPVEFVGVVTPDHPHRDNHRALIANLLAQAAALLDGSPPAPGGTPIQVAEQKRCPGDRPSTVLLLDRLTPEALGQLLALYEHKVHAEGVLLGINSFDQWGVELGKQIAKGVLPALEGGTLPEGTDASTVALVAEITAAWK